MEKNTSEKHSNKETNTSQKLAELLEFGGKKLSDNAEAFNKIHAS